MAKDKNVASPGLMGELLKLEVYKRNQGRVARQVTFFAILAIVVMAGYQLSGQPFLQFDWLVGSGYWFFAAFVLILGFLDFRLVNLPQFADFLIAVEAEMYKVSWPTRQELTRSSIVVIGVIVIMASLLFGFDLVWRVLFDKVLRIG